MRHPFPTLLLAGLLAVLAGCANTAYDRGVRSLAAGDPAAALTHFDEEIASGPRPAEATRERGAALLAQGEVDDALSELESSREALGDDKRLHWLLGQAYSQADRPGEAADAYRVYEALTSRRSVRKQVALRVAQLEQEVDRTEADRILTQRAGGVAPPANSVAVFSFVPIDGENASLQDQKICRALGIWVTADLAKVGSLRVVPAEQLDLIYREQSFTYQNRQMFAPASLVRAGNLQPARHMVRGVYGTVAGQQIGMGARCFDVDANRTDLCADLAGEAPDLFELETQLVLELLSVVGVQATPEERIAIGEKPTRNLDAFLAFADGVYLRDIGDLENAAAAFAEAAKIDPGFVMAKQYQAASEVESFDEVVMVSPPDPPSPANDRAVSSMGQLGLGLIPDAGTGDQQGGGTNGLTTVRGETTVRIRGTARGNQ